MNIAAATDADIQASQISHYNYKFLVSGIFL